MSFTLDGHTIETEPATLVSLACDSTQIMSGHDVAEGDFVGCDDCTDDDGEIATFCQVVGVFRTEIVPTVHI